MKNDKEPDIEKLAFDYAQSQGTNYPVEEIYQSMIWKQIKESFIAGYKAALQNNEVKITYRCKDPNCEYCHGTGEIKVDNPTSMIISYCECFGNGSMSSVPHREEPYKSDKVSDEEDDLWDAVMHFRKDHPEKVSDISAEAFGLDNPFPLKDVLQNLVNASEYLLDNKNYDKHDYEEIGICIKRAKEIIQKLEYASIVNERKGSAGSWISVEDSKPTTDSLLLTASGICIIGDWYKEGWRTHKSHWETDDDGVNRFVSAYKNESITHWMPLPAPPEPKQKEN